MSHDPEPTPVLAFEAALDQLERIVGDLERGEPELASALAKYEGAIKLLAHCHGLIDGAERTVALLTGVDDQGQPLTAPFDATATATATAPEPPARKVRQKGAKPSLLPGQDESEAPF